LNEFHDVKQGTKKIPEYQARLMELFINATHINTEALKVNMFLYGLNPIIKEKVCILRPTTLHEVVKQEIIAEEELLGNKRGIKPQIYHSMGNLLEGDENM